MNPSLPDRISTGVAGLDAILEGGIAPNRLYLVEGMPGAGKTTLALQFLLEGHARGERGLYVTLSETAEELNTVIASHGWTLEGIDVFDLSAAEAALRPDREMTLLHPWEVELGETVKLITDEAERVGAVRVVFDGLSEMRLLAQDGLRFRRQVLALKQFFAARGVTVLLLDDRVSSKGEADLQHSLCHGVVSLDRVTLDFGAARRRVEVVKMRGAHYREGWHDYVIRPGGLDVFPRLIASEQHHVPFAGEPVPSGLTELDSMFDGGMLRGTCTFLSGPAGTGKTTLAVQYVYSAAERGEHAAIYEFDERAGTLFTRTAALGLDLQPHIKAGRIFLRQVDPAELSPGEFIQMIRHNVERDNTRLLVIDSLNGYLATMPQERELVLQLHELLSFLNQRGVLTLLVSPQTGLLGDMQSTVNVSYIADAIILLRFFEASGHVRKAISILKNRGGRHEDTIRELRIDTSGLRIGEVLQGFQGVLTGTPTYVGAAGSLLEDRSDLNA